MFILASSSPRRKEILAKLVPPFEIIVPDIDESILDLPPKDLALEESKAKAYTISSKYPSDEILACDTVVIYANKALGKPHNKENAIAMLKMLNGKKHIVTSGYTYIGNGIEINRTVSTGGVIIPTAKFIQIIIPKCTGSTPSWVTTGINKGAIIIIAAPPSRNIPKSSNSILIIKSITYLLWVIPSRTPVSS